MARKSLFLRQIYDLIVTFIRHHPNSAGINDEAAQRREVRALEQAMQELQTHKSMLITTDETKDIETEKGFVQAVPAWLWALQLDKQFEQNIANGYQLPDMPGLFNGN